MSEPPLPPYNALYESMIPHQPRTSPDSPQIMNERLKEAVELAESKLLVGHDGSSADEYQQALWQIVNPGIKFHSYESLSDVGYLQRFLCATTAQRSEALRTIGAQPDDTSIDKDAVTLGKIGNILQAVGHSDSAAWLLDWFNAKNERIGQLENEIEAFRTLPQPTPYGR